jgi:hypothetical protein
VSGDEIACTISAPVTDGAATPGSIHPKPLLLLVGEPSARELHASSELSATAKRLRYFRCDSYPRQPVNAAKHLKIIG